MMVGNNALRKKWLAVLMAGMFLCLWRTSSEAAQTYTIVQTNPAPGTQLLMGSTVTFTYRITNTNTGGDVGEGLYNMRFRLPGTGTTFSSTTAAPAGWSRTAYSTTSVTFQASAWANTIATGAFLDFNLVLVLRTTTADVNETLRDARARYTTAGSFPNRVGSSVTINNPGSWTVKSLAASFQITDTSGNPITSLPAGNSFRLIMTVTNRSTVTQSTIVVGNAGNRPVPATTGTITLNNPTGVSVPNPLTLASGASGTITFTYTTVVGNSGTVTFTAFARNSTGVATSPTINSITLNVNIFIASITVNTPCAYPGQNITVTMRLTNQNAFNVINVTPTLNPLAGAPIILQSGPTPAAPNGPVPSGGGTFDFVWVYKISGGVPGQLFTFDGSAAGTGQTAGNPPISTPLPNTISAPITRGGYTISVTPIGTVASSANEELQWTFINDGCALVSSVSTLFPAGWSWGGDSYSLVNQVNPPNPDNIATETWTVSGANPVTFTASAGRQMGDNQSGAFDLLFTGTPVVTGVSNFTVTITDSNGATDVQTIPVTVNAYNTGGANATGIEVWREDFR